jgi:hypothetical protein
MGSVMGETCVRVRVPIKELSTEVKLLTLGVLSSYGYGNRHPQANGVSLANV